MEKNNPLGLHPITKAKPKMFEGFKMDWIFDKWYEKLIIAGSFLFTIITILLKIYHLIKS